MSPLGHVPYVCTSEQGDWALSDRLMAEAADLVQQTRDQDAHADAAFRRTLQAPQTSEHRLYVCDVNEQSAPSMQPVPPSATPRHVAALVAALSPTVADHDASGLYIAHACTVAWHMHVWVLGFHCS
jgi:hypothetical protein